MTLVFSAQLIPNSGGPRLCDWPTKSTVRIPKTEKHKTNFIRRCSVLTYQTTYRERMGPREFVAAIFSVDNNEMGSNANMPAGFTVTQICYLPNIQTLMRITRIREIVCFARPLISLAGGHLAGKRTLQFSILALTDGAGDSAERCFDTNY